MWHLSLFSVEDGRLCDLDSSLEGPVPSGSMDYTSG